LGRPGVAEDWGISPRSRASNSSKTDFEPAFRRLSHRQPVREGAAI